MTSLATRMVVAACAVIVPCGTLWAQDPVKTSPDHFTVLLENDRVRVLDFHSRSGAKIPMHSHPAYVSYSIAGAGRTRFTLPDGKITEEPAKTGQAVWHAAATHASEYVGSGEVHVLLVELKEPAPAKP